MEITHWITCNWLEILDPWWWQEKISILKISTAKWFSRFKESSSCLERSKEKLQITFYQRISISWLIKRMELLLNWSKYLMRMRKVARSCAGICVLKQQLIGVKDWWSLRKLCHRNLNKRIRKIVISTSSNCCNNRCNMINFNKNIRNKLAHHINRAHLAQINPNKSKLTINNSNKLKGLKYMLNNLLLPLATATNAVAQTQEAEADAEFPKLLQ